MPKRVPDELLRKVLSEIERRMLVRDACQKHGISEATFYRHKDRFRKPIPEIERADFSELGKTFHCKLFQTLAEKGNDSELRKLRRETPSIFKAAYSKLEPINPQRQLNNLEDLQKISSQVARCWATLDGHSVDLIARLEPPDAAGWNYAKLIEAIATFSSDLEADPAFQDLKSDARSSRRGGPAPDTRIKRTVVGLAFTLSKILNLQPTHTHNPRLDISTSLFNEFCREAFAHFVPGGFTNWAALDKAIKDHVPVIDYLHFHSNI
jgi:hypothetical protein